MLKTRYVVAAAGVLLVILTAVLFVLPRLDIETATKGNTYETAVFNQSKVSTVDITISDDDLTSILENPSEKEVVAADVTVNGETIKNVGFRTKGNLSLRSVVQMEDSDRYSWNIDFNYYESDQNLHGLKKLDLNNNYSDPTYMREYLSYELMEEMGVPTPSHSYMYVTINGQEWGLYLGVENINETFLGNNFAAGSGTLYYPDGTGSDLKWISDDIDDYTGLNLKTNENSTQSSTIKMLDAINNGGNLEDVLDVDEMLRYFAANTALVNLDHYQGSLKHNYYLYEENGKFSMIPWDYNMSFGGFSNGGMGFGKNTEKTEANDNLKNADKNEQAANDSKQKDAAKNGQSMPGNGAMMDMSSNFMAEDNINFSITEPVSGTTLEDRPLLHALLSNNEYREKYYDYLEEIANDFFKEENMAGMTEEISDLITPYVKKDPTKFYTMKEYEKAVSGDETLVDFAVQRADSIRAQISGDLVVEANTEGGMGGRAPNMDDANGMAMQPPDMDNGENGNNLPPDMGNAEDGNAMQPPVMGNGEKPNLDNAENGAAMQPPDMKNGGMQPPGMDENQQGLAGSSYSKETIIVSSILLVLLIWALVFAYTFKRRGRKNRN